MSATPLSPRRSSRHARSLWLTALVSGALLAGTAISPAAAVGDVGEVSGVVTLQGGGDPSGLLVSLNPFGGGYQPDPVFTGADGSYSFSGVPFGTWQLSVSPESFYSPYRGYFGSFFDLSAEATTRLENVELPLLPTGSGSITVTVVDAADDAPLALAAVDFFSDGGAANASGETDQFGVITFSHLPSGVFSVGVTFPGYVTQTRQIAVVDGEDTPAQFALTEANAAVTGTVRDVDGALLDGVWVSVVGADGTYLAGDSTVDGVYLFEGLGAGDVTIVAGGIGSGWTEIEAPATLIADETVTRDLTLTPRIAGSVFGTVVDADALGIADICGVIYNTTTEEAVAGFLPTDSSGTFFTDDLDLGTYTLLFFDCDYTRAPAYTTIYLGGAVSLASATTFSITAGTTTDVGVTTLERGATISGTVRLKAGDDSIPLPANRGVDAKLYVLDDGTWSEFPDPSPFVGSGGPGEYEAMGLPEGTYRVALGDPATGVKAYTTKYWQDTDDFDDATNVIVVGSTPITGIDAIVEVARPGYQPTPISTDSLTPDAAGDVSTDDDTLTQNELVDVEIGEEFAGEWVSVWGHSTPVQMGDWVLVGPTGRVTVPVPSSLPPGAHQLAALDAEGMLIGWTDVTVTPADTPDGALPATGLNQAQLLLFVGFGAALLVVGAVLLFARSQRRALAGTR